ncbi:MAG TPA: hypothetical protein VMH32_01930 [Burkholderiales bacterium]|nr:hypothetical protein [Burkholderiales bacterium]
MPRSTASALIAGNLLLASALPAAAAVAVDSLNVKPNPAHVAGNVSPEVELEVGIRDHGVTRILGCELALDFGDGAPEAIHTFMDGGVRKALVKHVYSKPGTYTVVARGAARGTGRACEGERRVSLVVIGEPAPEPAKEALPAAPPCPQGWALVPGSQAGNKFKCRLQPGAAKIDCPAGTKYFELDGMIGCQ